MMAHPALILSLLVAVAFSASTLLQPYAMKWTSARDSDHLMQVLLGDGRRVLGNHFFAQADVYFHSGYYPSVFDRQHAPTNSDHMVDSAADHHQEVGGHQEDEHEKAMSFLGQPADWIERFGRHFAITEHTHLEHGNEREILPWLKLSAELDPQRIETYTVASFWLSKELHKPKEAEEFLREGLKANPASYEILTELGRIYYENYHDALRARNVWETAYGRWLRQESGKKEPNLPGLAQIVVRLARLEEQQGHYAKAVDWLQTAIDRKVSPNAELLQEDLKKLKVEAARTGK